MAETKNLVEKCVILAGGMIGSVGVPLLFGTAGLGMLVGPLSDFAKDLFKGVGGDHVPRLGKAIRQRLGGVDPTLLNHHILKALKDAVLSTELSLRYWYKKEQGKELSPEGQVYVRELCKNISAELERLAKEPPARGKVDQWLGKGVEKGEEQLIELCDLDRDRIEQKDRGLADVIKGHFFEDLRLHFAEFIKDPQNHQTRVAFEQLTTDAILAEVDGLKVKLEKLDSIDGKLDQLLAGIVESGNAERVHANIERMEQAGPEPQVREAVGQALDAGLARLEERMHELRKIMHDVGARVVEVQSGVRSTVRQGRTNTVLILVVLAAVAGVSLLLIFNPFQVRAFDLKVRVDQPFDYGKNDVMARRLVIEYGGLRDTQVVKDGAVSFTIPESYRNDDVVMRLLCQDSGRTSLDLRVCDSMQVALTDKERYLFSSVAGSGAMAMASKPSSAKSAARTSASDGGADTGKPASSKPSPCALDGVEFQSESLFEDRLQLSSEGGGMIAISGQVNRKPVDGRMRVNGDRFTAQAGSGNLLSGSLTLRDCTHLTGSLRVRAGSGAEVPLTVALRDVRR